MSPIPGRLIARLQEARRVVVLTGAGISAESGVPTFRDALTGLWARYDPQELATPQAFRRDPKLVWDWYAWRRELVAGASPNPGHVALATLETRVPQFTLVTQNVDSLHARAGSRNIIELHGNLARVKCSADGRIVESWPDGPEVPPRCPDCGAFLRPDVVWFGEMLPPDALQAAITAAEQADVFLTVGTSGLVQPAASLPLMAIEAGALSVEVNPTETPLSQAMDICVREPAGVWLPELVSAVWPAVQDG
jgi:NAD-dependent deacetylase